MAKKENIEFNKNDDAMRLLISKMNRKFEAVSLGGGQKSIDKHHAKGKLTARERIEYLIDDESEFLEVGAFVGDGMYEEYGGCPSGGTVMGIGYVTGKQYDCC